MIIDGHAHAIANFSRANTLQKKLDELNVDKVVLCPGGTADPDYMPKIPNVKESIFVTNPKILLFSNRFLRFYSSKASTRDLGNKFVRSIVEQIPKRVLQYYYVNPLESDFLEKVKKDYNNWNYNGLKLHQCSVRFRNDSEEIKQLSEFAAEKNLPIFIHVFNRKEAKRLVETMREFPNTNYTIAHLMGLEEVIQFGKDLTNVYFDTSTYYIISKKRILKAIKHFGADHVIMGSDSPLGNENLANIKKKIESLEISNEERNFILGGSLTKLLKL